MVSPLLGLLFLFVLEIAPVFYSMTDDLGQSGLLVLADLVEKTVPDHLRKERPGQPVKIKAVFREDVDVTRGYVLFRYRPRTDDVEPPEIVAKEPREKRSVVGHPQVCFFRITLTAPGEDPLLSCQVLLFGRDGDCLFRFGERKELAAFRVSDIHGVIKRKSIIEGIARSPAEGETAGVPMVDDKVVDCAVYGEFSDRPQALPIRTELDELVLRTALRMGVWLRRPNDRPPRPEDQPREERLEQDVLLIKPVLAVNDERAAAAGDKDMANFVKMDARMGAASIRFAIATQVAVHFIRKNSRVR